MICKGCGIGESNCRAGTEAVQNIFPHSLFCAAAFLWSAQVPDGQEQFLKLNEELSQDWPVITEIGNVPEDADDWKDKTNKLDLLER